MTITLRPSLWGIAFSSSFVASLIYVIIYAVGQAWTSSGSDAFIWIGFVIFFLLFAYRVGYPLIAWPIRVLVSKDQLELKYLFRKKERVLAAEVESHSLTSTLAYSYLADARILGLKSGRAIVLSEEVLARIRPFPATSFGRPAINRVRPFLPGFKLQFRLKS